MKLLGLFVCFCSSRLVSVLLHWLRRQIDTNTGRGRRNERNKHKHAHSCWSSGVSTAARESSEGRERERLVLQHTGRETGGTW